MHYDMHRAKDVVKHNGSDATGKKERVVHTSLSVFTRICG